MLHLAPTTPWVSATLRGYRRRLRLLHHSPANQLERRRHASQSATPRAIDLERASVGVVNCVLSRRWPVWFESGCRTVECCCAGSIPTP